MLTVIKKTLEKRSLTLLKCYFVDFQWQFASWGSIVFYHGYISLNEIYRRLKNIIYIHNHSTADDSQIEVKKQIIIIYSFQQGLSTTCSKKPNNI